MRSIRPAEPADLPALYELDHVAREDAGRRDWLRGLVELGGCAVCVEDGRILGYGAMGYHFC